MSPEWVFSVVLICFVTSKSTADGLGPSPEVDSKGAEINIEHFLKEDGG